MTANPFRLLALKILRYPFNAALIAFSLILLAYAIGLPSAAHLVGALCFFGLHLLLRMVDKRAAGRND